MKSYWGPLLWTIAVSAGALLQAAQAPLRRPLPAPTYYIAVEARTCQKDLIEFSGASNLPRGAVIGFGVSDFDVDAWKDYSDEVYASVDEKGFFDGKIQPKKGMTFHRDLILVATFTTYRPRQLASVLRIVGKKGQNLGGINNPQVGQVSGPFYYLETIARVPFCGEGLDDSPARHK
jgi:hypothetical protein